MSHICIRNCLCYSGSSNKNPHKNLWTGPGLKSRDTTEMLARNERVYYASNVISNNSNSIGFFFFIPSSFLLITIFILSLLFEMYFDTRVHEYVHIYSLQESISSMSWKFLNMIWVNIYLNLKGTMQTSKSKKSSVAVGSSARHLEQQQFHRYVLSFPPHVISRPQYS